MVGIHDLDERLKVFEKGFIFKKTWFGHLFQKNKVVTPLCEHCGMASQINRISHFIDSDKGGFTTWVNMDMEKMSELRYKLELFSDVKQNMEKEIIALTSVVQGVASKVDALSTRLKVIEEKDFDTADANKDGVVSKNEWVEYAKNVNALNQDIIRTTQRNSIIANAIMAGFLLLSLIGYFVDRFF